MQNNKKNEVIMNYSTSNKRLMLVTSDGGVVNY